MRRGFKGGYILVCVGELAPSQETQSFSDIKKWSNIHGGGGKRSWAPGLRSTAAVCWALVWDRASLVCSGGHRHNPLNCSRYGFCPVPPPPPRPLGLWAYACCCAAASQLPHTEHRRRRARILPACRRERVGGNKEFSKMKGRNKIDTELRICVCVCVCVCGGGVCVPLVTWRKASSWIWGRGREEAGGGGDWFRGKIMIRKKDYTKDGR